MEPALALWLMLSCGGGAPGAVPAAATPGGEASSTAPLEAQQVAVTASGDAWIDAVAVLDGLLPAETAQELAVRARSRVKTRIRDHDDIRAAQYALAALMATEGSTPRTRAAFDVFEQAERASIAEESALAAAIISAAGVEGTERLRRSGAFDDGILSPATLGVKAMGRGAMQLPIDESTASDAVVLHLLRLRYGLAAEAVNIDGTLAALERAVADIDGIDPNATAALRAAMENLADRSVRFQRTKYQHVLELRELLGVRGWLDLLEQWSLVEYLGCVGCKQKEDSANPTLADQLLGLQAGSPGPQGAVGAATRANSAAGADGPSPPTAPGAQLNQGGQRPVGGASWAGMPQ